MTNYISEYQKAIAGGKIEACRKIKQALKRDQKDQRKSKKDDFPYYFNEGYAQKAIDFIELLPTAEGTPLKLELFQKYLISELFGWRKKKDDSRRFSRCFISMARKNGKSFLLSGIAALYLLVEDKPPENREILFTANTFSQSLVSFGMLKSALRHLAKISPAVRQRLKINNAEILDTKTNSRAIAMAATEKNVDSHRSDLALIDEYATATDSSIKDTLATGQINSDNALLAIISTSSNDLSSPMYQEYKFVSDILKGKKKADDYFIAIYENDYKNEFTKALKDQKLLEKSNPLLSNADRRAVMLPKLIDSINLSIQQDNTLPVMVKNMNMWLQARSNSYIPAKDWNKAEIEPPVIDGQPVWFGVDLSRSWDNSALSWLIPITVNGQEVMFADSHSWIGTKYGLDEKIKIDHFDYKKAAARGSCSITKLPSGTIDHEEMFEFMEKMIEDHHLKLQAVCYDPYYSEELVKFCDQHNYQAVEVRQGRITLSEPTLQFRDNLLNGKIKHSNNQLLEYYLNNCILKYDRGGNPLIDKARTQNKIDGIAALMDAWTQAKEYLLNKQVIHDSSFYSSPDFSF